jgi:hypothetical protein
VVPSRDLREIVGAVIATDTEVLDCADEISVLPYYFGKTERQQRRSFGSSAVQGAMPSKLRQAGSRR